MYEIFIDNDKYCYIIMDNLYFGLNETNLKTYDLKGSESNRFVNLYK